MARSLPNPSFENSRNFANIAGAFLCQAGLPFASILSAERIHAVFAKHGALFGTGRIYSTSIVLWAFLSQVLRDGKDASCQAAVARVVSFRQEQGSSIPTEDTGDYCRARAKLHPAAIRELSCDVAEEIEQAAAFNWLWKGKYHPKLIDGFTFTMPDSEENQAKYPQQKGQKPGVGFPIARAVAVISLATACVMDLAFGPYKGKESGETALLRTIFGSLRPGDIAVMDRYYCSFMLIALLSNQHTHICARKHHLRHSDFRRGKRLGKYDHLIEWTRPQRPKWMEEETYAQIPETLLLREIRFSVVERGRRTKVIDVITTLTDAEEFSKQEIADLYGYRWDSELDIRSIKSDLNLGHVRCKTPSMVIRELWTTILGYNLIRMTGAVAALLHDKQPRQISFTSICQYVLSSWMQLSSGLIAAERLESYTRQMLKQISACEVRNRPGRLEPRMLKRRRHGYPLMQRSRNELRAELRKRCT